MSRRFRALSLSFLAGAELLVFVPIAANIDQRLFWAALFGGLAIEWYAMTIECPQCGTPTLKKRTKLFGSDFWYWSVFIGHKCESCGLNHGENL
jgi:hypothetical protein